MGIQGSAQGLLSWIEGLGPWGPAAFIGVYVVATVLFIPGSVLTLGAGAVFGLWRGYLYTAAGSVGGATAAFLIGRHMARGRVSRLVAAHPRFRTVDEAVARDGWIIVLLTRLSPVFPFNLLNYAFGLTDIPLGAYVAASWLGMLPGTFLYVYLGALAGDLSLRRDGRTAAEWAATILGLAATLLVTLYATRLARKALRTP